MQNFIKVIEQAGFSVTNGDSYENIEIKDLTNNNETFEKKCGDGIAWFAGSKGSNILLSNGVFGTSQFVNYIQFSNGMMVSNRSGEEGCNLYRIEVKFDDGTKGIVGIRVYLDIEQKKHGEVHHKQSDEISVGGVTLSVERVKDEFSISKDDVNYGYLEISQGILEAVINNNNHDTSYSIDKCNAELYINAIMSFLNNNKLTSNNPKFQEGFKFILPALTQSIENIFTVHKASIDAFIEYLERDKERLMAEYQAKIANIDEDISILQNLSKPHKTL